MDMIEIKKRIDKIKSMEGDDEMQHSEEDDLYLGLLRHLAKNAGNYRADEIAAMCEEAIKVHGLVFCRWCA